jgi:Beta-lactamase enzyme family/ORF 12 gene product N-terminal
MNQSSRRAGALAATLLALVACGGSSTATPTTTVTARTTAAPTTTTVTTSTTAAEVALPDTPPGRQLRWVLDNAANAGDVDFPEHFSADFLAQLPAAQLRTAIAEAGVGKVIEIVDSSPAKLVVFADSADGKLAISISVDATGPHLITSLLAQPAELPDAPTTWEGVDAAVTAAAPTAEILAAEVGQDGSFTPLHTLGNDKPVPLGSAFKLYVLGALVHAVESGSITWDDTLTITDELKSLPSGELQDRPAGSTVTVREAAEKMIQISDNTATDLLIDKLGRDAVEAILTPMGMGAGSRQRTLPFITTRQLFTLKWGVERGVLDAYIAADVDGRRTILAGIGHQLPTAGEVDASTPVAIDGVEWFASPSEVASAHIWLDRYRALPGFEPLATILGTDPGVPLDPKVWTESSFKGGSEPGVVFVGWLLHRADGRTFTVVVSATNPNAAVDELAVASAASGIVNLLAVER